MILILFFILVPAGAILLLSPESGVPALVGAALIFIYYRVMAMHRFGGVTGDLAGYFLQLCELAILGFVVMGGVLL